MLGLKISLYLLAFVFANFIVLWFGAKGLIFTALFLVPFDFVIRCLFHETWKGMELFLKLGALVINRDSLNIALGSACGFISAQIAAGIFYQLTIKRNYFIKVNGSDAVGILIDSIIFQIVAFEIIIPSITLSQFLLKIVGGFFWYWIIFIRLKLQEKL